MTHLSHVESFKLEVCRVPGGLSLQIGDEGSVCRASPEFRRQIIHTHHTLVDRQVSSDVPHCVDLGGSPIGALSKRQGAVSVQASHEGRKRSCRLSAVLRPWRQRHVIQLDVHTLEANEGRGSRPCPVPDRHLSVLHASLFQRKRDRRKALQAWKGAECWSDGSD